RRGSGRRSFRAERGPAHCPGATATGVLPGADTTSARGVVRDPSFGARGRVHLGGPWLSTWRRSRRGVRTSPQPKQGSIGPLLGLPAGEGGGGGTESP